MPGRRCGPVCCVAGLFPILSDPQGSPPVGKNPAPYRRTLLDDLGVVSEKEESASGFPESLSRSPGEGRMIGSVAGRSIRGVPRHSRVLASGDLAEQLEGGETVSTGRKKVELQAEVVRRPP